MTSGVQTGGPFVRSAFLCDTLIEGKDGTNSYIRQIDQYVVQAVRVAQSPGVEQSGTDESPPESLPETAFRGWLIVGFVAGRARGRLPLRVSLMTPDGLSTNMTREIDITFDGREHHAINVHLQLNMPIKSEGVHWFRVHVDGREQTRVPLEVRYQRT